MAVAAEDPGHRTGQRPGIRTRLMRLVGHPGFQRWAAGVPGIRRIARREGQDLFDIVQGFVASQVLYALVELRVLHLLKDGPQTAGAVARTVGLPEPRMIRLLQAGAALGLLKRQRDGFALSRKGSALTGVPGLEQMIRHHDVLYRDLSDPVAFLRGETEPELAQFWPYVFGAQGAVDPDTVATYSDLMTQSQALVAQDTLRSLSLRGVTSLLDVGGGSGAFAEAAARATKGLRVTLFDLPQVIASAEARLARSPQRDRITLARGSFRDDPLPGGAEAVSLIRVLYDHEDDTVRALLDKVHAALPAGGRVIVSEPMSGGARPDPAGDVYFAFYCMAMRTGTVRSQAEIAALLRAAGFARIHAPQAFRPFVTSVVTAEKA